MKASQQQVEKLLQGNHTFSQLGFSMLLTRLKGLYAKDPSGIGKYTSEINVFLEKFNSIMANDYAIISKL